MDQSGHAYRKCPVIVIVIIALPSVNVPAVSLWLIVNPDVVRDVNPHTLLSPLDHISMYLADVIAAVYSEVNVTVYTPVDE